MGEAELTERSAAERLTAWRGRIVDALTRTIALIAAPLAVWIGYDAVRLGVAPVMWAVLAFEVSALVCASLRGRWRLRAWWTVANFTLVLWLTTPFAGTHAGSGAVIALIAVLGAVVLSPREAALALGLAMAGQVLWGLLALGAVVPRPVPAASDVGVPIVALRDLFVTGCLAVVMLFAISYLIRQLTRTLFESEQLIESQRAEMMAREEEARRRRKAEAELIRAQKLELLARIAGGLVHDVNNNLTVALAGAELIERSQGADERSRRLGTSIREACENASVLSRQLLALGRPQLSTPEVVQLEAILPRLERLLRTILGRSVQFEIALAADLPPVWVDPRQLEQVLLNLVINARDALSASGKITLSAEQLGPTPSYQRATSAQPVESAVRLHVSDDGLGIDHQDLPQLFEPFFTTKGPERGTGLGLSVARAFVEANGGRLGVRTTPGQGSTFTLELPVAPKHLQLRPSSKAARAASVLLVEDDTRVRASMRSALEAAGYQVWEAADGAEALERARGVQVDLLCTDSRMPRLGGEELIRRFKSLHPDARVLMCSAYVEEQGLRDLVSAGQYAVLSKPFTSTELRDAVVRALAEPEQPDRASA